MYNKTTDKLLCYRFHDVITKFSKIKLQITSSNSKMHKDTKKDENEI